MLGIQDQAPTVVDEMIMPVPWMGVGVISIGMMKADPHDVIAWRGPILDRALQQFLADVFWGDLDFLLIDLPPGTGDVALSLGHKLPNAEVLVVTTPQQAAADVAERAGTMASLLEQKVIGVVENMSHLDVTCPHCGQSHRVDVFGTGGGAAVAEALSSRLEYEVPLIAEIPMDPEVSAAGDHGVPVILMRPEDAVAQAFDSLAEHFATRKRSLSGKKLPINVV
jgi:ATP-binding protein involved in chromosome partitioning